MLYIGEEGYLQALSDTLKFPLRETRNSKCHTRFGVILNFNNIEENFPLLTTKKMAWKSVKEELLWFISGSTDSKELSKKGVKIWNGNSSEETLKKLNLPYREGDCGPIYGFQWRKFGQKYIPLGKDQECEKIPFDLDDCYMDDNSGDVIQKSNSMDGLDREGTDEGRLFYRKIIEKGYDQLGEIIKTLKEDPNSRRMFMSAWNPKQLSEMCLPPCHISYQFFREGDSLSCMTMQRSADMFLGVPFNIASCALLVKIIAKEIGIKAGNIILCLGDTHIYQSHTEAVNTQIERIPGRLPQVRIDNFTSFDKINSDDIILENYSSHGVIHAEMVV